MGEIVGNLKLIDNKRFDSSKRVWSRAFKLLPARGLYAVRTAAGTVLVSAEFRTERLELWTTGLQEASWRTYQDRF